MGSFTPELLITLGGMAIAGVVWAVRLEGRINSHDRELQYIREQHDQSFEQLRDDIAYIRTRIDQVLGR